MTEKYRTASVAWLAGKMKTGKMKEKGKNK